MLEGLARIHRAGVLHGDPQLGNVLLPDANSESGRPVWVDFERSSDLETGEAESEMEECRHRLEDRRENRVRK